MNAKQFAAPAALALMIAAGLPAHAGGGKSTPAPVVCPPAPVKSIPLPIICPPAPVKSNPLPVICPPAPVKSNPLPVICNPLPIKCDPTPVVCPPAPVKPNPVPECGPKGAVPEPASVALVGLGSLLLLPVAMRTLKARRQID